MDIVESLRKYQCPENKGCNPVVEYCQCALMDSGADKIERLREALKPFAEVLKGNWSNQSDDMIMSFGFGNDKRLELTLGDFRKARAALKENE